MHSINNCMDGSRFSSSSHECCPTVVWKTDGGVELCQYIDLCFHASSLPCLHTFWHAIPTSSFTFLMFLFSCSCWNHLTDEIVSQVRPFFARKWPVRRSFAGVVDSLLYGRPCCHSRLNVEGVPRICDRFKRCRLMRSMHIQPKLKTLTEGLLTPWNLVRFWLKSLEILTEILKSLPKSEIWNLKTLRNLVI